MIIRAVTPFRVTRNADVDSDLDDVDDLLIAVRKASGPGGWKAWCGSSCPSSADPEIRRLLMEELEIADEDVYEMPGLLEYRIPASHRRPPRRPISATRRGGRSCRGGCETIRTSIFDVIRAGDLLVHHPYDSFDDTVLRFVREAVEDPDVLAIKMTFYRTGRRSPFVPLLVQAAEAGKQVACLVELTARFDEQENIQLAKRMEKAGVHVVYGVEGLKTHTKTALVVRRETKRGALLRAHRHRQLPRRHGAHLRGSRPAHLPAGADVGPRPRVQLPDGPEPDRRDYRTLLVAPANMKRRFLEMIDREAAHQAAGRPAAIIAKMNQLEDRDICQALYAAALVGRAHRPASSAGSRSWRRRRRWRRNLRLISIVGRYLEHSRIFYFRNGAEREVDGEFYIGSADWMHRNLESRVEVVTPIADAALRQDLWEILHIYLADHRSAWDMQPDGSYVQRRPQGSTQASVPDGAQQALMQRARREASRRSSAKRR